MCTALSVALSASQLQYFLKPHWLMQRSLWSEALSDLSVVPLMDQARKARRTSRAGWRRERQYSVGGPLFFKNALITIQLHSNWESN